MALRSLAVYYNKRGVYEKRGWLNKISLCMSGCRLTFGHLTVNDADCAFRPFGYTEVVSDHYNCVAHFVKFGEEFENFGAAALVKGTGRFVGEKK